jgi:hypothetical protein
MTCDFVSSSSNESCCLWCGPSLPVRDVLDMYQRITGKELDLSDKDPNAAATE